LTPSELRVARLAADGRSNPEIARLLFLTRRTVETHLTHAYQKLEIASRDDLASALMKDLAT
jgi:DNA-binding CsgD family transcriptional regulator